MKILIVDDHPLLRAGLARLFTVEFGATVAEASDAVEGLLLFRTFQPEIVVLDLNLPGEGGLSLLQTLRSEDVGVRVLVLSMRGDVWSAEAALRLGAVGYLSKSAAPDLILEAMREVRAGHRYVEAAIASAMEAAAGREPARGWASLSVQEMDLLRLLLDGERPDRIAASLGITEKTVANRKSMLRTKLGATSDIELLKSARDAGFFPA